MMRSLQLARRGHQRQIPFVLKHLICSVHFALASVSQNLLLSRRRLSIPPIPPLGRHDVAATATSSANTDSTRVLSFRGGRQRPAPKPGDVGRSSSQPKAGENSTSHRKPSQQSGTIPPDVPRRSINKKVREALSFFQEKLPCLRIRVEPTTKVKLRKTLYPLGATVLKLGADFDAQLGIWQFRSSWEDRVIGGALSVVGRVIQIQKTWRFGLDYGKIGSQEDFMTSVRFRAALDFATMQAYAKVGFRPEKIRPLNIYDGFRVSKRLPLDGKRERIKLELKARLALPEPEVGFSTETSKILVGLGDVEMTLEELNLLVDY